MKSLEQVVLEYIRWCIDNGHYTDEQYDYLLNVGDLIIKNWKQGQEQVIL